MSGVRSLLRSESARVLLGVLLVASGSVVAHARVADRVRATPTPTVTVQSVQAELTAALRQRALTGSPAPSFQEVSSAPLTAMGPSPLNTRCWPTRAEWTVPLCAYGDLTSKTTVLLTGDSEAFMWAPAFAAAASSLGIRVVMMIKALCPAEAEPAYYWDDWTPYPECAKFHAVVDQWVKVHRPTLVFATGRSPLIVVGGSEQRADASRTASGFLRMQQDFHSPTSKVYLLPLTVASPAGDYPYTPPNCVLGNLNAVYRCAVPRTSGAFETVLDQGIEIAVAHRTVATIAVDRLLCTAKACPAVSGHYLLYTDGDHVSRKWMWHIAPALKQLLRPILARAGVKT
ncbi:MAG TPA: SGNH hydrolase domain-containing protein [Acidimicrobiales bacterium]|jgi:hypothetical protein|nr:SGNH hydrolase domain-containing protein [Acidimicrobiales bacterium]